MATAINDQTGEILDLVDNKWVSRGSPQAQPTPPQQEQPSLSASSFLEPAATIASGMIAEPIAGLAGLAGAPFGAQQGAQNVENVRSALTYTPRTPEGLAGLESLAETLQPITEMIGGAESALGEKGADIAGPLGGAIGETIPTAAMMAVGPMARGIKAARSPTKIQKTITRLTGEAAPTIDKLKDTARGIYNELDDAGAVVNSGRLDGLRRSLETMAKRQGIDDTLHPKSSAAIRKINQTEGFDSNLTEIDTLRKVAKSAAESIDPSDARLGGLMVDRIDDFLDDLSPGDFTKGKIKDAGGKFKDARQLWQRAKKSELLEDAFEKARNQASGFENGIRVQFRSILNNKKRIRGFSPEEKQLMQQVVRGGTAENIAKRLGKLGFGEGQATSMLMGSLGVAGGAAVGGAPGAVAVPLIGSVSRKLAQKLTARNAELSNSVIRAGQDGKKIIDAYIKSVPAKQRDIAELTELLLRPRISLPKLTSKAKIPTATQKLRADSVFFADFIRSQQESEGLAGGQ